MKSIQKLVVVLMSVCMSLFLALTAYARGGLAIHFIDVGQADAAFIICDNEVMMIDGGSTKDSSLIYSYLTDTLRVKHINYMIASHPHEDHIGGLAGALNACTVGVLYSPVKEHDSEAFRSLEKYAAMQKLEITIPTIGESFPLGEANVQILSPQYSYREENNLSIIVRIVYGQTSALFTGDAEFDAECDLVDSDYEISSTLLKVEHHGSDTSSSSAFLRAVSPELAIICVGTDNAYEHPSDAVLNRLAVLDVQVFRTDLCGNIIGYSDGRSFTVTKEKVKQLLFDNNGKNNLYCFIHTHGYNKKADVLAADKLFFPRTKQVAGSLIQGRIPQRSPLCVCLPAVAHHRWDATGADLMAGWCVVVSSIHPHVGGQMSKSLFDDIQNIRDGIYIIDVGRCKEKIERVFADSKEKHAMRYTPFRSLAQVSNWVRLKFAALNLKKLARWLARFHLPFSFSLLYVSFILKTQFSLPRKLGFSTV